MLSAEKSLHAHLGFLHPAQIRLPLQHPELTNEEYVSPAEYAKYMLNSIFTPCPKGRSLDTFRLYEAMEAGSIPVRM
jgi:hypothetical protein